MGGEFLLTVGDVWFNDQRQTSKAIDKIRELKPFKLSEFSGDMEKQLTLGEVEIKAARIVQKTDGWQLYPSERQKESARSGYSVLQQLSLPNIRIDEVSHSISAIDNKGSVQVRINGIIVDKSEMLSLDPKSIRKIDFIDNPGVRYGDGIAYVIDITTRRADNGYTLGTSFTQALTAKNGDYSAYGKWNSGKSEFSLNYSFGYQDLKGSRMKETANYHLNDGTIHTIQRNDIASRDQSFHNLVKLTYNLADSTHYVFQASLSAPNRNRAKAEAPCSTSIISSSSRPGNRLHSMPSAPTSIPKRPTATTRARLINMMSTARPTHS